MSVLLADWLGVVGYAAVGLGIGLGVVLGVELVRWARDSLDDD